MVDRQTLEKWRNAPRLTSFASFFDRTASGQGGAPGLGEPEMDMALFDFDLEVAVFSDTYRRLGGPFDSHYVASIPYRYEEACRMGAAIFSFALRIWARNAAPTTIYTLGTGTGRMSRTLSVLGDGRIETLCCSPTEANRDAFYANRGSEHAHFFLGPFFDLNQERYATDPDLAAFRSGFDVLVEDTTFQMYDSDRRKQLEFIVPRIRPGGILILVQKLAQRDPRVYEKRERQKDEHFKARYFSADDIAEKKDEVVSTMGSLQVDLETTTSALASFFRYGVLTWNSGNFYTIIASNSRASILELVSLLLKPAIPPAYCYEALPGVILDTEADALAPSLTWRTAKTMTPVAPRRAVAS